MRSGVWPPTRVLKAIRTFLVEHDLSLVEQDLFGKPAATCPDHALAGLPKKRLVAFIVHLGRLILLEAGNLRPGVTHADRLAQRLKQFFGGVIVLPAAAFAQLGDMGPATLRQGVPSARDTVVRAGLPFRHEKRPEVPVLSGFAMVKGTRVRTDTRSLPTQFAVATGKPGKSQT